ncbi:MAG TPA: response regulator transcription factor [Candidatus Polarisedimenticolaceae bacterium]
MSRPRVLLADDHRIVAEGLRTLLSADFELVGIVEDGLALVSAVGELKPDVVVADISMPGLGGLDALERLNRDHPGTKVVFLTMHPEVAYARRALQLGAAGYVLKHSAPVELILAIRAALAGDVFITPTLVGPLMRHPKGGESGPAAAVTPRQREILELLAEGRSAKEIAAILSISTRTVESHKYQMMEAWGFHTSAELVTFAIKLGIVRI